MPQHGNVYVTDLIQVTGTDPVVLAPALPENVKYVLKKIYIYNSDSSDHKVTIGQYDASSATWEDDKLIVPVKTGEYEVIGEKELPEDFVVTEDKATAVKAWAAKLDASATNPVYVKAEFELR